jgi:hypothetical protein
LNKKIPCVYLFIYKIFKQKANGNIWISYSCVKEILHRKFYVLPRQLHYVFLKEMEEFKLIKKHGNTKEIKYELLSGNFDKLLNQYNLPF